eukprot:6330208-Lingulodinium_polyedra.AAC.1
MRLPWRGCRCLRPRRGGRGPRLRVHIYLHAAICASHPPIASSWHNCSPSCHHGCAPATSPGPKQ